VKETDPQRPPLSRLGRPPLSWPPLTRPTGPGRATGTGRQAGNAKRQVDNHKSLTFDPQDLV